MSQLCSSVFSPRFFSPGLLFHIQDGDLAIGQSMAIVRYCAQTAGLCGEGKDWITSEMMLEEHNDIFDCYVAAKYRHASPDSQAAWDHCVKEAVPKHLAVLEAKITASGFFGSKLCAGDLAICSNINFGLDNGLDLTPFPKLSALYAKVCSGDGVCAAYVASAPGPYFKRPAAPESTKSV
jgi:glutathione S-transferase